MIKQRRQARERRQYVYAKSLETQERQTYERKQQLKDALASGKSLPTELRKQARELGKDLAFDEAQAGWVRPTLFLRAGFNKNPLNCRTNDTRRQRIFKSRNNRPEGHSDNVEGPELEVAAVCQGMEEAKAVFPFCSSLLTRICVGDALGFSQFVQD